MAGEKEKIQVEHIDKIKKWLYARLAQLGGAAVFFLGLVSCLSAPFSGGSVQDSFGAMMFGIIMAAIGKGGEQLLKDL